MEQTAQVAEAAIAWATEVYRRAPAVALGAEAVPLAEPPAVEAARGRAVPEVPLVWAAALAVARGAAVAGGGGNQT